jgi:hypothetical protein
MIDVEDGVAISTELAEETLPAQLVVSQWGEKRGLDKKKKTSAEKV